jgi:hypothetical protein
VITVPTRTPITGATATRKTHRQAVIVGARLARRKLTTPMPSLKRWTMTTVAMTIPRPPPTASAAASATPSRKLWMPIPVAPTTPMCWWDAASWSSSDAVLVADVQRRDLVECIERQEAGRDDEHRRIDRPEMRDGLRDEIEERGPDPDPAPAAMITPT